MLNERQKKEMLLLARQSIEQRFNHPAPKIPADPLYRQSFGVFVSIHKRGDLRGCIGYIKAYKELGQSIVEMAQAAAFRDPRFSPVKADELALLKLEISILSEMYPIQGPQDLVIGRDGLFIDHPSGSGLLLPQVATEWAWNPEQFVQQVCRKAGLDKAAWQDEGSELFRFEAEVFSEEA